MPRIRSILLAIPLIELALLIALAVVIGAGTTFLIVLGTAVAGIALLAVARRAQTPGAPAFGMAGKLFQGGAVPISGALLLIPGVLTDLLGLVLLIPGPRRWLLNSMKKWTFKRMTGMDLKDMPFGNPFDPSSGAGPGAEPGSSDGPTIIVDAEVTAVRDDRS